MLPALEARDVSVRYGTALALDDISMQIQPGEVRCMAGENGSGKSTFVKAVAGMVPIAEGGAIRVGETDLSIAHPPRSVDAGVQVIYQDLSLFSHMSVADNIAMSRIVREKRPFVSRRAITSIAEEAMQRLGVSLDLDENTSRLSVANQQLVAICRALTMNARLLFMDEPTTALTSSEVGRLLQVVDELRRSGMAVVFISHKLDEIFEVSDSITIFRDGRKVGDFAAGELDKRSLSFHMTGREVEYARYRRATKNTDSPALEVRDLSSKGHFANVSLKVRPGDIVGLTGLLGSGRTELALSLFGLNRPDSGAIEIDGRPAQLQSPAEAVRRGIALVPEDRKQQGLFGERGIGANLTAAVLDRVSRGVIQVEKERALAEELLDEVGVNHRDLEMPVNRLSGGNQQKVVLGKWVATSPKVLILDSPTVGIDIGSKAQLYDRIHRLADEGMGVILISDEVEEILANCNHVLVMREGSVVAELDEARLASPNAGELIEELVGQDPTTKEEGE